MLDLTIDPGIRERLPGAAWARLRRRFDRMVRAAGLTENLGLELEAAVRITCDAVIRELNRDYRHKDKPTDVLAFAQREGEGGALHPHILGDIVISAETAARQARRGLEHELLFLACHGLCHLLGYDHQDDAEEAAMNARMAALLSEAERTGRTRPA